ncbi:hydroxypyruvate isomerase family protein [Arcicella rosea]|uniref:Hydroxypyruvate isomerase n=1 Tax=Arcicella rosea TaxID=502909 RepID=A0A841EM71_9BACT|nr:TIM barrel protein [Arcicella rosea]MBB6003274.1 hydroxypyruvate isomerase [Arcicella rosea]
MKRRDFTKNIIAGTGLATLPSFAKSADQVNLVTPQPAFKLKYAPHFGMFQNSAGKDEIDQLKFMHEMGFRALEDNGMMGRSPELQKKIGDTMAKLDMSMGVFVIDGGDNWKTSLATGKQEFKDVFVNTCKKAVEVAKRCNAKYMTIVPGYFERNLPIGVQTANVIDAFRRGAEIFEPHGLVMVMEPLSDNADLFLRHSDQSFLICKAVNSPSCKILFDMWHMQRNEGRMTQHMDWVWDEIAYFQIGDEPGRKEPTTGEINYKFLFKHIHEKAKATNRGEFILGMEHGNSIGGKEGEMKLIEAYRASDLA